MDTGFAPNSPLRGIRSAPGLAEIAIPRRGRPVLASSPAMVSRQECHQLASLARLSLDDDEAERFAGELSPILGYIEQLRGVDTEGVAEYLPPSRPGSALRADEAQASGLSRERALAAAFDVRDEQIAVPKFKED